MEIITRHAKTHIVIISQYFLEYLFPSMTSLTMNDRVCLNISHISRYYQPSFASLCNGEFSWKVQSCRKWAISNNFWCVYISSRKLLMALNGERIERFHVTPIIRDTPQIFLHYVFHTIIFRVSTLNIENHLVLIVFDIFPAVHYSS